MPKFVIEREIEGVGKLPKEQLQAISKSRAECCTTWVRNSMDS